MHHRETGDAPTDGGGLELPRFAVLKVCDEARLAGRQAVVFTKRPDCKALGFLWPCDTKPLDSRISSVLLLPNGRTRQHESLMQSGICHGRCRHRPDEDQFC